MRINELNVVHWIYTLLYAVQKCMEMGKNHLAPTLDACSQLFCFAGREMPIQYLGNAENSILQLKYGIDVVAHQCARVNEQYELRERSIVLAHHQINVFVCYLSLAFSANCNEICSTVQWTVIPCVCMSFGLWWWLAALIQCHCSAH